MISFEIMKRNGVLGLYIRNYACQGINPDYTLFKQVDERMADYLVESGLAGEMRSDKP